jgi:hypothetical protein
LVVTHPHDPVTTVQKLSDRIKDLEDRRSASLERLSLGEVGEIAVVAEVVAAGLRVASSTHSAVLSSVAEDEG